MRKPGFTYVEVLIVLGLLAFAASLSIPLYRKYQIRSDLDFAANQILQALGRAQLLAQAGKDSERWGVHVPTGTLYQGANYALRSPSADESYSYPSTITSSGLTEVSFSRIEGKPSTTGTITLQAITGDQRTIEILITEQGISTYQDDEFTVCHQKGGPNCETKVIQDNAWPGHQGHGDYLGPCVDYDGDGDICDDD